MVDREGAPARRAYKPFFTTKPVGSGAGLGLATCCAIVRQHHGFVQMRTELGQGTMIRIHLPALDRRSIPPAAPTTSRPLRGGNETILLCEDEEAVRGLACRMLQEAGYRVLVAAEGQEALDRAERHSGPIDLLVTDVIMPGMTGKQLSAALAERRPGLPTLISSRYTSNILAQHGVIGQGICFLAKPYTRQALLSRVREILDGASGG